MRTQRVSPSSDDLENVVWQSLERPNLLNGGERRLMFVLYMAAALMVAIFCLSHLLTFLLAAWVLAFPGTWTARAIARHDPQWLEIYMEALVEPYVREPHGYAYDRESAPLPIIAKPEWMNK